MIYVGIDPGYCKTGVVGVNGRTTKIFEKLVESAPEGKGNAPKRVDFARLEKIQREVEEFVYANFGVGDSIFAIEEPFVGHSGPTALKQHAVFVALFLRLRERGFSVVSVHPSTIKKFVGFRDKTMIARQVYKLWQYEADDDNLVDAFAIAKWLSNQ